jgi:hypothetical protein
MADRKQKLELGPLCQGSCHLRSMKWGIGVVMLAGCGQATALPATTHPSTVVSAAPGEPLALQASTPGQASGPTRHVGDTTVHRFSGSFRKHPLLLTEEVVRADSTTFTVRYILEDGTKQSELLVTRANRSGRIVNVMRLEKGEEIPAQTSDYELMVQKTLFVPDQNGGEISKKASTCLVGETEHDCEVAEYRVYVKEKEARLLVAHSDQLGRDVSGEIVAVDGTMIYHAELLEVNQAELPSHRDELAVIVPLDSDSQQ